MVKKIILSHSNNIAAILQNNKIQEIILITNTYQVNDIYIGVVQKIFSSINAAFVKLSQNAKSGFIHINDIKSLKKNRHISHITEVLSVNQIVLVQVTKEPTLNKGPRLTTNINLSGRYLALMPFCNIICISHRIHDQNERIHLHSLAVLLKPSMMGILIKSSAQGMPEDAIIKDLNDLKKQWNFIEKVIISSPFPSLIYKEKDLIKRTIRDNYEESVEDIIIDSEDGLKQIKYYLNKWQCTESSKIQFYKNNECILENFRIKDTILKALKPQVKLASGGHLIIESNEALTVIDVNSGSFNKSDNSKETILKTNLYAAIEIAYQLKIRNINGVVIIDFIDMISQRDQLQLLEHFSKLLKLDHAKPQIIQLSKLGLVELTRRRRGQSLQELFYSNNHSYFNLYKNLVPEYNHKNKTVKEKQNYLSNEQIKKMFFNKQFTKNIILKHNNEQNFSTSLDDKSTINLINPKKNYIVPLVIYSETLSVVNNV